MQYQNAKVEILNFFMCDTYDVFNTVLKNNIQENKLNVDSKKYKKSFEVMSKFLQFIQITSIIAHFIQKFKMICK